MFEKLYKILDIPSGAIMGIFTLSMIAFCWLAVLKKLVIPPEVMAIYAAVLGAYATSKTITKVAGKE